MATGVASKNALPYSVLHVIFRQVAERLRSLKQLGLKTGKTDTTALFTCFQYTLGNGYLDTFGITVQSLFQTDWMKWQLKYIHIQYGENIIGILAHAVLTSAFH